MVYNDSTGKGLGRENILHVDSLHVLGGAKQATSLKDTSSEEDESRWRPDDINNQHRYNKL